MNVSGDVEQPHAGGEGDSAVFLYRHVLAPLSHSVFGLALCAR